MLKDVLAIVCPGQGSQTPGFLTPWLDVPGVSQHLQRLSEEAGLDLIRFGTTADEETIKDTAVAQPLIVAASLVSAAALDLEPAPAGTVVAGHSVGEIAAATLAGVLSEAEAMRFVSERAQAMAVATRSTPSAMAAVLGGDQQEVLQAIEEAGLSPANVNGASQIVAAGAQDRVATFAQNPPAKARVIPLKVAGAFHTDFMREARVALEKGAPSYATADPATSLLTNFDGSAVSRGNEYLEHLVAQVTRPVRWDLVMQTLSDQGVDGILELAPAGTLVGLAKRALKGVPTFAVKSPEDLDGAKAFIAEHLPV